MRDVTFVICYTLRHEQNGCRVADSIFKCIFLNENYYILIQIPLKFVPSSPNDKSTLVQVMVWHRTGNKSLHEPMMTQFTWIYASPGLNVLS